MKKRSIRVTLFATLALLAAIIGAFSTALTLKYKTPFRPSFFNYKASMSKRNQELVFKTFDYKQFSEINEFTVALINNHAVAGIGTDYLAASLIKRGVLKKIDYASLLDIPDLKEDEVEEALKVILAPEVFNHLQKYDQFLNQNNTSDKKIHLYDYFFPYFAQDAVIAYNPLKVQNAFSESNEGKIDFESETKRLNLEGDAHKMINILKVLSANNYNKWVITDAVRDNMLYGSGYDLPINSDKRTDENFTGKVDVENYITLIDNFKDLIKDGTGFDVKDTNNISFKGDGLEVLNNLISPSEKNANVTIMYNGDAIDAYYSEDNNKDVEAGTAIKIIRPNKNIFLVDGLVLSSSIDVENEKQYLRNLSQNVYKNANKAYLQYRNLKQIYPNYSFEQLRKMAQIKAEESYFNDWQNPYFESVISEYYSEDDSNSVKQASKNLTDNLNQKHFEIALKSEDEYLNFYKDVIYSYFENLLEKFKESVGEIKLQDSEKIADKLKDNKQLILFYDAIVKILDKNETQTQKQKTNDDYQNSNLSEALNKELLSEEQILTFLVNTYSWVDLSYGDDDGDHKNDLPKWKQSLWMDKYTNIDNFDYINYSLVIDADKRFIYKNYFYDGDGEDNQELQEMFKITPDSDDSVHEALMPVDGYLNSAIATEYYKKTKS
ncbi:hypothetical protein V2E24_00170 [Mycoplasmopsis ciconiae]|uniref:Spermidine/putrescine ABC transporter substrate-binding protein n=1 Tax=Mycoplasmopsis ciconiae TaxID=561067 RepID=A0ABU7MKE2_9BACT|nr:hypothetical protein [Mycoplasmopsis ciconiae]